MIDFVLDMLPEPIGDISRQAQNHLSGLVAAYDALAPKPDEWPEGAKYCAIDADGHAFWYRGEPEALATVWIGVSPSLRCRFTLHLGIDWRLCMWKRLEVQP